MDMLLIAHIDGSQMLVSKNHTVDGNPMRLHANVIQIREDLEWQAQLPVDRRRLIELLSFGSLRKYGYTTRSSDSGPNPNSRIHESCSPHHD